MKKLLFIRYKINDGIEEGGVVNSQTNLNVLKSLFGSENIDEYAIHNKKCKQNITKKLYGCYYFFKNMHYGITPDKLKEIAIKASNYEYIFIDRSIFGIIAKYLKSNNYKGKIIVFFHNFEPIYFKDSIANFNPLKSQILKCVQKNEKWSCQYADKIIALNQRDNVLLENHYQRKADILIPVSFKNTYYPNDDIKHYFFDTPPTCLFFGTYFPANSEGILWFIKNVLPFVNIKLQIIGKNMDALTHQLKTHPNIEIHGSVPDLKPFLEHADFLILPIFKGSGMKVKTCEAMMYGKYIIGSQETFEGYDVDFSKIGCLANTKEEFITAIETLILKNPHKYNEYSRQFFLENHSFEATYQKFKTLFEIRSTEDGKIQ